MKMQYKYYKNWRYRPLDPLLLACEQLVALQDSRAVFPTTIKRASGASMPEKMHQTRARAVDTSHNTSRQSLSQCQHAIHLATTAIQLRQKVHEFKAPQSVVNSMLRVSLTLVPSNITTVKSAQEWQNQDFLRLERNLTFSKEGFTNISPDGVLVTTSGASFSLCWSSALTWEVNQINLLIWEPTDINKLMQENAAQSDELPIR